MQYFKFWSNIKVQLNNEVYQERRLEPWLNDPPGNPLKRHFKEGAKSSPNSGRDKGRFFIYCSSPRGEELLLLKFNFMDIDQEKAEEAVRKGTPYAFIPHPLEISWKPELNNFPFNVLFVSHVIKDGRKITGTALYEPDFFTFNKEGPFSFMRYHNAYGGNCYLMIGYDENKNLHHGKKYVNGEQAGFAESEGDWNRFFVLLTMLGLVKGEKCEFKFEAIKGQTNGSCP